MALTDKPEIFYIKLFQQHIDELIQEQMREKIFWTKENSYSDWSHRIKQGSNFALPKLKDYCINQASGLTGATLVTCPATGAALASAGPLSSVVGAWYEAGKIIHHYSADINRNDLYDLHPLERDPEMKKKYFVCSCGDCVDEKRMNTVGYLIGKAESRLIKDGVKYATLGTSKLYGVGKKLGHWLHLIKPSKDRMAKKLKDSATPSSRYQGCKKAQGALYILFNGKMDELVGSLISNDGWKRIRDAVP